MAAREVGRAGDGCRAYGRRVIEITYLYQNKYYLLINSQQKNADTGGAGRIKYLHTGSGQQINLNGWITLFLHNQSGVRRE